MIIYREGRRIKTGSKFRNPQRIAQLRMERINDGIATLEIELATTEADEIKRLKSINGHRKTFQPQPVAAVA